MKKAVNIYLDEDLHKQAKKRIVDLETSLSEYIANLIQHEIDSDLIPSLKNGCCKPNDGVA